MRNDSKQNENGIIPDVCACENQTVCPNVVQEAEQPMISQLEIQYHCIPNASKEKLANFLI